VNLRPQKPIKTRWFVLYPLSYGSATLARFGLCLPGGRRLLLHYFPPYEAPKFHDHPWHFRTLVLWGGYTDLSPCPAAHSGAEGCEVCDSTGLVADELRAGSYRSRPALHRHRTIVRRRTFTIVFTGPHEREWCEGTPETWVCGGEVEDFDSTRGMVKVPR
jgi:hypothetical protein